MTNIVLLKTGPKPPEDLSKRLREIADFADEGKVTSLIAGFVNEGEYEFLWGSSLEDRVFILELMKHATHKQFLLP
jgi:hypothetical protein